MRPFGRERGFMATKVKSVPCKGYEKQYLVYNDGRVWSIRSNKFLKPCKCTNGYLRYTLYKNGRAKQHYAHRLVAIQFIPNPHKLPQVNHKDENKENNHVDNLEWVTARRNCNYGHHNKRLSRSLQGRTLSKETRIRISKARGTGRVLQYSMNMQFIRAWKSMSAASRALNIDVSNISKCCRHIYRQAGGYIWRREEETMAA